MDDSSGVVWTVAAVLTGALVAGGSLMWSDRKIKAAWIYFMASSLPMVVATLVWAPMSQNHFWQIAIPGTVGAIMGALALIGLTQIIHNSASAQNAAEVPNPTPQVAQNVTSYDQKGGITAGTVNIAPQRFVFSAEVGAALIKAMPNKKTILLYTVGGNVDQNIGTEVQAFLVQNGYSVNRTAIGMRAPPPEGPIELSDSPTNYTLTIAPSIH